MNRLVPRGSIPEKVLLGENQQNLAVIQLGPGEPAVFPREAVRLEQFEVERMLEELCSEKAEVSRMLKELHAQKDEIRRLKEEEEPEPKKKIVEERKMSWNEKQAVIDVEASPKAQLRNSGGGKDLNNTMSVFAVSNVGEIRRDAVVSAVKLTSELEVLPEANKPYEDRYA